MAASILGNITDAHISKKALKWTGSCLCSSVKFELTGDPVARVLCHCLSCKRASGSSFMANAFYDKSQFQLLEGASSLQTYRDTSPDSGGIVLRSFCRNCGSPIIITNPAYDNVAIVPKGALDWRTDDSWVPEKEFFCKRRVAWLDTAGSAEEMMFQAMS